MHQEIFWGQGKWGIFWNYSVLNGLGDSKCKGSEKRPSLIMEVVASVSMM